MAQSTKLAIYVAGPITGTSDYRARFIEGTKDMLIRGHIPVNPIDLGDCDLGDPIANYGAYLKRDLRTMLQCDGIYLLRGWQNSKGATLEKQIADACGMVVLFQEDGKS